MVGYEMLAQGQWDLTLEQASAAGGVRWGAVGTHTGAVPRTGRWLPLTLCPEVRYKRRAKETSWQGAVEPALSSAG